VRCGGAGLGRIWRAALRLPFIAASSRSTSAVTRRLRSSILLSIVGLEEGEEYQTVAGFVTGTRDFRAQSVYRIGEHRSFVKTVR